MQSREEIMMGATKKITEAVSNTCKSLIELNEEGNNEEGLETIDAVCSICMFPVVQMLLQAVRASDIDDESEQVKIIFDHCVTLAMNGIVTVIEQETGKDADMEADIQLSVKVSEADVEKTLH